jgi:Holliday junction resolvase RusA-like endonuclease
MPQKPISGPVHIVYRLYMQTRRRVDDLNLFGALDDILVKNHVLQDDNITVIRSRDGSRVFYDKENPRAEIYIYKYNEEEDEYAANVYGRQISGSE